MSERKSSAFGAKKSAVTPPAAPHPAEQPPEPALGEEVNPKAPREPKSAPRAEQAASEPLKDKKKKVSFYQLPADEKRARAAWMHTMGHTGHITITSFMETAIAEYTHRLEKEFNKSQPFD